MSFKRGVLIHVVDASGKADAEGNQVCESINNPVAARNSLGAEAALIRRGMKQRKNKKKQARDKELRICIEALILISMMQTWM